MNAIQYILKRRNLNQTNLADMLMMKRENVSKWVRRERTIPAYHQESIEKFLKVPKRFFIDDTRKCKNLTDEEVNELDEFFLKQNFDFEVESMDEQYWIDREVIRRSRQNNIEYDIKVLKKMLEQDIRALEIDEELITEDNLIDGWEANIGFYKRFFEIRRLGKIQEIEWASIMKVLAYMSTDEKYESEEENLVGDIYNVITKYRKQRADETREIMELFGDAWGETRSDMQDQ